MMHRRLKPVEQASREGGFTLFETLVALTMLSIGLAVFYRAVAAGASGEARIERAAAALQIAKARLAAAGIEDRLSVGERSGEDAAGYRWKVMVAPYRSGSRPVLAGPVAAYEVTVEVSWPGAASVNRPSITLTTLKLAPPS